MSISLFFFYFLPSPILGINVNLKKSNGETAFLWACFNGRSEVAGVLASDERVDVNEGDNEGHTPLFYAAGNGHVATIVQLIISGRKVEVGPPGDRFTDSIGWAREKRKWNCLELLEKFKANPEATRTQLLELHPPVGGHGIEGKSSPAGAQGADGKAPLESEGGHAKKDGVDQAKIPPTPPHPEGGEEDPKQLREEVQRLRTENEELRREVRDLRAQLEIATAK